MMESDYECARLLGEAERCTSDTRVKAAIRDAFNELVRTREAALAEIRENKRC